MNKRAFPGVARNAGILVAKGDIFAFIDADCVADEHCIENIVKAHCEHDAVGGWIENGNPEKLIGCGLYLCEFGKFVGGKKRLLSNIPGYNVSYKKIIFKKYGEFPQNRTCQAVFVQFTDC